MILKIGLLALAVLFEVAREVCFKLGSISSTSKKHYMAGVLGTPLVWLGFLLWGAKVVVWLWVLQRVPLSIAFPLMSLSYGVLPLASYLILHERLTRQQMTGIALVILGVGLVGSIGL